MDVSWLRYCTVALYFLFLAAKGASRSRYTLVNPKASFAQFNQWVVSRKGSFTFYFKTYQPDALLVYQDDGISDYFSVVLSGGKIVLSLGSAGQTYRLKASQSVNDMTWHKVSIKHGFRQSSLTLDNEIKTATISSRNAAFVKSPSRALYFGGLPTSVSISTLAVPGVVFEKRFVGCVKDVKVWPGKIGRAEDLSMVNSVDTKRGCRNACRLRNPCRNGGKCKNRFWRAECDCRGTGYEGDRCNVEPPRLSFGKGDYATHEMIPTATASDNLRLIFKTTKPDGVLLQTSFSRDYLLIELYRGSIVVQLDLGSGGLRLEIGQGRVSDGRWHLIEIARKKRHFKMALDDGKETVQGTCPGRLTKFNMQGGEGKVFIARAGSSRSVSGDKFEGCIKELKFNGQEWVRKLWKSDPHFKTVGKVSFSCSTPTTSVPTTATTRNPDSSSGTTVETQIQTTATTVIMTMPASTRITKMTSSINTPITTEPQAKKRETTKTRRTKVTMVTEAPTRRREKEVTMAKCFLPWKRNNRSCRKGRKKNRNKNKNRRASTTAKPRSTTKSTTNLSKAPTRKTSPTSSCSPNDVKCNGATRDKMTSRPLPVTESCTGQECSSGGRTEDSFVTSAPSPFSQTGRYQNSTTEAPLASARKQGKKVGNIGVVIGLVIGSLVLVSVCGLISYRLKKRTVDYKLNDKNSFDYTPDGKKANGKAFEDEFLV